MTLLILLPLYLSTEATKKHDKVITECHGTTEEGQLFVQDNQGHIEEETFERDLNAE